MVIEEQEVVSAAVYIRSALLATQRECSSAESLFVFALGSCIVDRPLVHQDPQRVWKCLVYACM